MVSSNQPEGLLHIINCRSNDINSKSLAGLCYILAKQMTIATSEYEEQNCAVFMFESSASTPTLYPKHSVFLYEA